jgi:predicted transcriptional regulator
LNKTEKENIERWKKSLSDLQNNIIKFVSTNPNIDYKSISKEVDRDRITIKQSIESLIKKNYIKKIKVYPNREKSKLGFSLTHKGLIYSLGILEGRTKALKDLDEQFQEFLKYLRISKPNETEHFKILVCLGFLNYDLFNEEGKMICENDYEIAKQMFRIFLLYRSQDSYFDIENLFLPETSGVEFMKKNHNYNPLLKKIFIKLKENIEKSIDSLSTS